MCRGNATSQDLSLGYTLLIPCTCVTFTDSASETNKWPIFVQANRSHDAASVHTLEMFAKYASRANKAMRRELYL